MQSDNGRLNFGAGIDNSQLRIDAQESKRILNGIGTTAKQEGNEIDTAMKNIGKSIAGVFAVSKLKDFAKQVAVVRGEFQQLEIAFQTMLGSKAEADKLMSQLIQTAVITPFNMSDVANSAKQLLAYGVEADKVNETLIRLGDIAAGLSIPINDLAYLYGTTMVQGRMYTQDLNQFLGRGIPLTEELAKQFGVTKNKVKSLVEEGKVGFPEVEKAIISLTSEGGKFGGLMEAQSKSITGQISNIEDQIEQMFNEIGKSSEGAIGAALNGVSSVIDHWKEIGKVILIAATAYGTYKAALIAMNVIQKISNTLTAEAALQQKLAAMSGIALSEAEAVAAARTTLLAAAWHGLKVAIMSNPIGLILGVLAGAATALGLFSSETSEAVTMSEKFGESAAKEISRLNTLTTTYKGLTQGTSTHRKVLEELNGILEEYGIAQIKEGDNMDTVNAKREKAIELIKLEGIERQRANNLDQGEQDYQKGVEEAQAELAERLSSAMSLNRVGWVSANEEIRENANAIQEIIGETIKENISEIAGKTGDEYQKGLEKIYATIEQKMRVIGISEKTISEGWVTGGLINHDIVQDFIDKVQDLAEAHDRYDDAMNKTADAARKAAEGTMTFSDRVSATQRSLQGAADDVHGLYKRIKELMSKYNENSIGFTVKFNVEVPKWMANMKLSELQRLAARFSALGDQAAKSGMGGMKVGGKWYTTQQLLQRGADYSQAAENKQNKAEQKQRDLDATEKERKRKAEQEKKKAAEEQKRIADQTADRNKAIQKYKESVIEQNKQAELDIAQQQLENMEDGYEKQKKQIEINYERLIAENEKRQKQMIDALADNKLNEWMNAHPKATKQQQVDYRQSLVDPKSKNHLTLSDLSADQQEMLAAYEKIAQDIKDKAMTTLDENRVASERASMQSFLKEYGDYQEKRLALTQEAEDKIAKLKKNKNISDTDRDYQVKSIQKGLEKSLKDLDFDKLKKDINWDYIFGDLENTAPEAVAAVKEQLQQFIDTAKDLSPDQIKTVTDALQKLQDRMDLSAPITTIKSARKEYAAAKKEYDKYNKAYQKAKKSNDTKGMTDASNGMVKSSQKMTKAANKEKKSYNEVIAIVDEYAKALTEAGDTMGGTTGDMLKMAASAITCGTSMAKGIDQFKNAVSNMEKSIAILAIIEAALKAIQLIASIFGDTADETLTDYVDTMKLYIDLLSESISNLSDSMEDAKNSMKDTISYYERLVRLPKEPATAIKSQSQVWLNSGASKGFLGIGSSSSEGVKIRKQIEKDMASGNEEVKKFYTDGYNALNEYFKKATGRYAQAASDFGRMDFIWTLSDDDIIKLSEDTKAMALLGDTLGQAVSDYAAKIKEAKEQELSLAENLLSVSFDDFYDDFVDMIKDMDKTSEDFAQNFAEYMRNALVKNLIAEKYKDNLQKLYEKAAAWAKEGKLEDHIDELRKEYQDYAENAQKETEVIDKITGYQNDTDTREASSKGIASASQESIDELNGRMTAIQGHTYSLNENTKMLVQTTNLILRSVQNIDRHTEELPDRLSSMESNIKSVKDTVNDIALKGIKIKA